MFGHIVKFSVLRPLTGSHGRVRVRVCARQSPLTCPEASFPNFHGTVIAKFKQWSRGPLHHTIPADKADQMGRGQRAKRSKFCLYCGSHQDAVRERKETGKQGKARQSRQGKTSQRGSPKEGV